MSVRSGQDGRFVALPEMETAEHQALGPERASPEVWRFHARETPIAWRSMDSPLALIRHLSVIASHRIAFGANGSDVASVTDLAMFLRLFSTHACTVRLGSQDGAVWAVAIGARQAWITPVAGAVWLTVEPASQGGRLYVNEFG